MHISCEAQGGTRTGSEEQERPDAEEGKKEDTSGGKGRVWQGDRENIPENRTKPDMKISCAV